MGPGRSRLTAVCRSLTICSHAMAKHGGFDLACTARATLAWTATTRSRISGLCLAMRSKQAIGDGRGIQRFAHAIIPMDESIAQVALDCGGRGYLVFTGTFGNKIVGTIPADIFEHFFYILCATGPASRPISRSPGRTTTTSARRSSRHSGLRWARRCP